MRLKICPSTAGLGRQLEAGYFVPDLESVHACPTVVFGSYPMAPWTEVRTDRPKGRSETLRMTSRFKASHRALTLPRRLVRILRSIVQTLMAAVFDT